VSVLCSANAQNGVGNAPTYSGVDEPDARSGGIEEEVAILMLE
jgi:hypothetical protein